MRSFFFFNDTATTEIYTLSLHDALPIFRWADMGAIERRAGGVHRQRAGRLLRRGDASFANAGPRADRHWRTTQDRKSTRLNSSHSQISYAVFCLKKKPPPRPHSGCARAP